jgi:hypothetical protein
MGGVYCRVDALGMSDIVACKRVAIHPHTRVAPIPPCWGVNYNAEHFHSRYELEVFITCRSVTSEALRVAVRLMRWVNGLSIDMMKLTRLRSRYPHRAGFLLLGDVSQVFFRARRQSWTIMFLDRT